jgi:hypothetical protein
MFEGGTSLSKVFRLIERFSEDIDLILGWRVLTSDDPMSPSFVIDGSLFSSKNAVLNRKLAKAKRDKLQPQRIWLEKAIERESDPKKQELLETLNSEEH